MRKSRFLCSGIVLCGLLFLLAVVEPSLARVMAAAELKSGGAQAAPQRASPSEPPVPGLPKSERVEPKRGQTEQYALSEDRYEKAVAYSRAGYALYFVSYFLSFAVLLLFLRFGVAAKFRDFAERVTGRRWLQGVVLVPLLILTSDIFDLPLRLYSDALP